MWLALSLLTAFCVGTSDALAKKALASRPALTIAWVRVGWGALFLLPCLLWAQPPEEPVRYWYYMLCALPFEVAAALCLNRAMKSMPLSLAIPYLAFTPVFLLASGWLLLNERPTTLGVVGVLAVTGGAIILPMDSLSWKAASFRRLVPRSEGAWLMVLVSFLFAVTTTFAKKAMLSANPLYFSGTYFAMTALGLLPFQMGRGHLKALISMPRLFAAIGILEATTLLAQFTALALADTAYVISIKRLGFLLAVFYGWKFFGDTHIGARWAGALLMLAGSILIAFA